MVRSSLRETPAGNAESASLTYSSRILWRIRVISTSSIAPELLCGLRGQASRMRGPAALLLKRTRLFFAKARVRAAEQSFDDVSLREGGCCPNSGLAMLAICLTAEYFSLPFTYPQHRSTQPTDNCPITITRRRYSRRKSVAGNHRPQRIARQKTQVAPALRGGDAEDAASLCCF